MCEEPVEEEVFSNPRATKSSYLGKSESRALPRAEIRSISFGVSFVAGNRRVPNPAARENAFLIILFNF